MEEKTYKFVEHSGANLPPRTFEVKEADLTSTQRNLLLGEVIKLFNDLPEREQYRFMQQALDSIPDKPSPQKKRVIDKLIDDMNDDIQAFLNRDK